MTMISKMLSAVDQSMVLVLGLLFFSGCTVAQHMQSNQEIDYYNASGSPSVANARDAQEWARQRLEKSPRHQEWVKVKYKPAGGTSEREVSAFMVYPEVKTKATAVIV